MVDRTSRISEEVRRELSEIVQNELKDPRLPRLTSITSVDVTKDLRYAKVFISVLGTDEEKKNAIKALKNAAGYIRREIGHRMQIRYTPEFHFELDTSIEHGIHMSQLINSVSKHEGQGGAENKSDTGNEDDE